MMTYDDPETTLEEFRRELPPPAYVHLTAADQTRLYRPVELLISRDAHPKRTDTRPTAPERRQFVRRLVAVPILTASVVAVIGLFLTSPDKAVLRPEVSTADPVTVTTLRQMSAVVTSQPEVVVRDDQFVYVRSQVIWNEGTLGGDNSLSAPSPREVWLSQRPISSGEDGLIRDAIGEAVMGARPGERAGIRRPTYTWLASLPTQPEALRQTLLSESDLLPGHDPDQALFMSIGTLLSETLLPPRTAAALYGVVAGIPGVTVEPNATDAIGRRGTGISRADTKFQTRSVWIFSEDTAELLGTRDYQVVGGKAGAGPEELFGATSVLERAVVDQQGQTPN